VDGSEEPEREVSLDFLRAQARSAYQACQATRYDATGHILPALIRGVETAARIVGSGSLAACAVRAREFFPAFFVRFRSGGSLGRYEFR